jgi:hypothetical protein
MKFCNHCGAQLTGDERFCASCGADVNAPAPASSAPAPVPTPVPIPAPTLAPAAAVQYAAPAVLQPRPAGIADPFAFHAPVAPAAPMAEVPHSHSGVHWSWIILAVVIAAGYFYNKQNTPAAPGPAPAQGTPAGAPAQGTPAAPGAPAPQPGDPAQPAAAPPAGNSPNAALLQQQSFSGHWQSAYGTITVTNGIWTNHSNVALQSAVLECDQYSATGADLAQWKENLTGPVAAGASANFNPFQMGTANNLMSKVNCAIVDVTPAS